jgi:acyl-CoA reductase-like NAD-dependent aldehyde dehydrogenase
LVEKKVKIKPNANGFLKKIFINNEFVNSVSGKTFPTYNPATEELIAQVQEGDSADIENAVKAARKAFQIGSEWRTMDPSARGQMILKLAELMKRDSEYLAVKNEIKPP